MPANIVTETVDLIIDSFLVKDPTTNNRLH